MLNKDSSNLTYHDIFEIEYLEHWRHPNNLQRYVTYFLSLTTWNICKNITTMTLYTNAGCKIGLCGWKFTSQRTQTNPVPYTNWTNLHGPHNGSLRHELGTEWRGRAELAGARYDPSREFPKFSEPSRSLPAICSSTASNTPDTFNLFLWDEIKQMPLGQE
jgi:hypothetical protein